MRLKDTIAAIATPPYEGGIAVIRISGEDAIPVADKIFRSESGKKLSDAAGYTLHYGKVYTLKGEFIDTALASVFHAPRSYTGDNAAEISCHGGAMAAGEILNALYEAGARPAEPGEFTKRAFLAGKMDLTQAEAVMDIISAKSRASLKLASRQLEGTTGRLIRDIRGKVITLLAEIGAYVDFSEENVVDLSREELLENINECIKRCSHLDESYEAGSVIKEGIPTVITGKPNVGKSMLMNLLSGFERSIVTEHVGTTRDIIEDTVRVGDILLRLSDTAGLRETEDPVESIGVSLAKKRIRQSRLILAVFDGSRELDDEDIRLISAVGKAKDEGTDAIAVINKSDLPQKLDSQAFDLINDTFSHVVMMSAKTGEGSDTLKDAIIKTALVGGEWEVALNARHRESIISAKDYLQKAEDGLNSGMPLDMATSDLSLAAEALGEITGETVNEDVVAEIFSRFCIGK